MDSVERLFHAFPAPEDTVAPQEGEYRKQVHDALQQFLQAPRSTTRDPDCEEIRKIVVSGMGLKFCEFASQLSQFALSKRRLVDDSPAKAVQLLYYRWVALGRRDDDYPFTREYTNFQLGEGGQSLKSYDFLPESLTCPRFCSYCDSPGSNVRCLDCQIIIDPQIIQGESYCRKACADAHWPEHCAVCLDRRSLYRSVAILYDLFLLIKEKTYPVQLASIREQHGVVFTQEKSWDKAACAGEMAIRPFPRALASSKEQFRAVLLSADCDSVMAVYKLLLDDFIKPLCAGVEEVSINPRNVHIPVCCPHEGAVQNHMFGTHMLLRATLPSGEQFAIDLSGGKFGWGEIIVPWRQWVQHRAVGSIVSNSYGSVQRQLEEVEPFLGNISKVTRRETKTLIRNTQRTVRANMLRRGVRAVDQLQSLSADEFQALREDTHLIAASALDLGLEELRASKRCRLYFDRSWQPCATETSAQGDTLSRAWFTKGMMEDLEERRADREQYRRIWSTRWEGLPEIFRRLGHNMP